MFFSKKRKKLTDKQLLGAFYALPTETIFHIFHFLYPSEIVNISCLNSNFRQHTESDMIWKFYNHTFTFYPNNLLSEGFKNIVKSQQYFWHLSSKHKRKHLKLSQNNMCVESTATSTIKSDIIFTENGVSSGKTFFRVRFDQAKLGSFVGVASKSEIPELLKDSSYKCTKYFRDGSMITQTGERLNRVQERNGKRYKVYYPVSKGDILEVLLDVDKQLLQFYVNGHLGTVLTKKLIKKDEPLYFVLGLPAKMKFTVLSNLKKRQEVNTPEKKEPPKLQTFSV